MHSPPEQLKQFADKSAKLLSMRVMIVETPATRKESEDFTVYLKQIDDQTNPEWFNGEYLGKKITLAMLKQCMQHLHIPAAGRTVKAEIAKCLLEHVHKDVPSTLMPEEETLAIGVLNRWFMKPLPTQGTSAASLKQGLANEAHVLHLLKEHFAGADQDTTDECFEITKIISVGLLESKTHARIGTSVDAIVMLRITNKNENTVTYEPACVEVKTKTTPNTVQERANYLPKRSSHSN
jgi:hypothetical protein